MKRTLLILLVFTVVLGLGWLVSHSLFSVGVETPTLANLSDPPTPTPTPAPVSAAAPGGEWKTYSADQLFEISYPLGLYSMRDARSFSPAADLVSPGPKVLIPDDSFYYRQPRALTYKIFVAVRLNSQHLSLDAAETLLTQNSIYPYEPGALQGVTSQPFLLDGVNALRVEDVAGGSTGRITLQIVAIKNDYIYDILVEPQQLSNGAEPFQPGAFSAPVWDLMNSILATFKFGAQ
jgi:hypothetical protein